MTNFKDYDHIHERYFREKVIKGEPITEMDRIRHLKYIKNYGKSSFANRWNVPMISTRGMPQPDGEIYRDDIIPKYINISKEELESLKKQILELNQKNQDLNLENSKLQEENKILSQKNKILTEEVNAPVYKKIFRRNKIKR